MFLHDKKIRMVSHTLFIWIRGEKKNLNIWATVDSVLPAWTWSLLMFPAFISSDYVSYTPVIRDKKLISSWFYLGKKWGLWDCWVLPRAGHLHQGIMVIVLLTEHDQHRTPSERDWLQHFVTRMSYTAASKRKTVLNMPHSENLGEGQKSHLRL